MTIVTFKAFICITSYMFFSPLKIKGLTSACDPLPTAFYMGDLMILNRTPCKHANIICEQKDMEAPL